MAEQSGFFMIGGAQVGSGNEADCSRCEAAVHLAVARGRTCHGPRSIERDVRGRGWESREARR